ncbi:MAG: ABC transporter substrate-binding protein [Candidatus Atribacteria bacterium]|nr:ABC transporter substrate-binding protein [Candidatus Atribacteria bacterium]
MKIKLLICFLLAVVLTFSIVGISFASETLTFAIAADVDQLDPGDTNISQVVNNIFEGLVKFKAGSTSIEPCLATSWEISEDGKEITFHLRKGVQFHDGTDFNADAVVFSFARQYDPNNFYHQYGKWGMWRFMFYDVDRMEKIDDHTVKLVLKKPNVSILTSLALYRVGIVSPTNSEKYKEDTFKNPCGTGPFKFVEWVKDEHVTLEVNEDYWQERAKLDRLIFKIIPDPAVRLMTLEVGEVQGIEYPNPADFDRIKANKDLVLMTQPGLNVGWLEINTGYGYIDANKNGVRDIADEPLVKTPGYFEPLTKKEVRQAINMAIDKQSIIDNIYIGAAIKAKNGMPPFMLGYNDAIEDYPYDPARAKQLLAEAGYPDGFEVTLYVLPASRPYMFDPFKIAEAIQSYLAAVGIKVKFYQVDWPTYLQETKDGKHQICMIGWIGDNGDPDNFMNVYSMNRASIGMAQNRAFYINEDVQGLLSAALATYDDEKRTIYYKKIQKMVHEDAAWVYLFHLTQNIVFKNNIKGFILSPISLLFFYPVWVE